jgi:predicted transcriptional regulator
MLTKLKSPKRQVAHKSWICDLLNGKFVKGEGWNPSYVELSDRKVSRINLTATVVSKFTSEDGNYGAITLDDGTETIRSKAFGPDTAKFVPVKVGAIIRFVGKVKEYNGEVYLSPEIVRPLEDPNWIIVHKLELKSPASGAPAPEVMKPSISENVAEEVIKDQDQSVQINMLDIIKGLDAGEGAEIEKVIQSSKLEQEEAKNIIIGLLKSGDVYEPRKGKLKVLV